MILLIADLQDSPQMILKFICKREAGAMSIHMGMLEIINHSRAAALGGPPGLPGSAAHLRRRDHLTAAEAGALELFHLRVCAHVDRYLLYCFTAACLPWWLSAFASFTHRRMGDHTLRS